MDNRTNIIPAGVHVITDTAPLLFGTLFLLPPPCRSGYMSKRVAIRAQMTKVFQRFPSDPHNDT
jgi:hypothetical protein